MLTAKKLILDGNPAWKIWVLVINGRTFHIDGQNHAFDSGEWEIFEEVINFFGQKENIWIDTVPTKKAALIDLGK